MANASTIAMIEAKHLLRAAGLSCRAIVRRLSICATADGGQCSPPVILEVAPAE
jgi:hypothetical protein